MTQMMRLILTIRKTLRTMLIDEDDDTADDDDDDEDDMMMTHLCA